MAVDLSFLPDQPQVRKRKPEGLDLSFLPDQPDPAAPPRAAAPTPKVDLSFLPDQPSAPGPAAEPRPSLVDRVAGAIFGAKESATALPVQNLPIFPPPERIVRTPAGELYERSLKAYQNGDQAEALALATKARAMEPGLIEAQRMIERINPVRATVRQVSTDTYNAALDAYLGNDQEKALRLAQKALIQDRRNTEALRMVERLTQAVGLTTPAPVAAPPPGPGREGQIIYPPVSTAGEVIRGLPKAWLDLQFPNPTDAAAALAYEGAGAVRGVTLGYVDPTPLVEKVPMFRDAPISKAAAETGGVFVGALAPIGAIGRGVQAVTAPIKAFQAVRPWLMTLFQAGATGGLYGAARKPEENQTRAMNAANDAATFIAFTGAFQGVARIMNKTILVPDVKKAEIFEKAKEAGIDAYAKGGTKADARDVFLKTLEEEADAAVKSVKAGTPGTAVQPKGFTEPATEVHIPTAFSRGLSRILARVRRPSFGGVKPVEPFDVGFEPGPEPLGGSSKPGPGPGRDAPGSGFIPMSSAPPRPLEVPVPPVRMLRPNFPIPSRFRIPQADIRARAEMIHHDAMQEREAKLSPLEQFVVENGGIATYKPNPVTGKVEEAEEYRDVPVRLRGGTPADIMAQQAADANLLPPGASGDDLREAIKRFQKRGPVPRIQDFYQDARRELENEYEEYGPPSRRPQRNFGTPEPQPFESRGEYNAGQPEKPIEAAGSREALKVGPARAVFRGWQDRAPYDTPVPMYNILGDHKQFGSTVGPTTLKSLGLEIPSTPTFAEWKAGGSKVQEPRAGYGTENPIFYSQLQRTIQEKMPTAAPAVMVRNLLDPAKGNVKAEEVEWSGIDDFLAGKEKVTKAELLDFLKSNEVQIKEVVKGRTSRASDKEIEDLRNRMDEQYRLTGDYGGLDIELAEMEGDLSGSPGYEDQTKFSKYQTPGGENYREFLLTLPIKPLSINEYSARQLVDDDGKLIDKIGMFDQSGNLVWYGERISDHRMDKSLAISETKKKFAELRPGGMPRKFESSHFDEPNIIAHVRMNDRTTADGKKVLFLEEVQSDWHQKGRDGGYKTSVSSMTHEILPSMISSRSTGPDGFGIYRRGSDSTDLVYRTLAEAEAALAAGEKSGTVPNAPFKKTWHELALKRMLRYAVDNGYDGIAWTTGEQQTERYWGNDLIAPAVQRFVQVTKPESVRKLADDVFGREMASAMPLDVMDGGMLAVLQKDQVRRAVIKAFPADVVNILSVANTTPEKLFSDPKMVFPRLPVDSRNRVAIAAIDAIRQTDTTLRAKLRNLGEAGREGLLLPALKASDLNSREVAGLLSPESIFHLESGPAPKELASARTVTEALSSRMRSIENAKIPPAELAQLLNAHASIIHGREGLLQQGFEAPPGAGMKGFYDQIIPSFLNKYTKKWGGRVGEATITGASKEANRYEDLKIEQIEAPGEKKYAVLGKLKDDGKWIYVSGKDYPTREAAKIELSDLEGGGNVSVHSLDITPAMRGSVAQGQPLFEKHGEYGITQAEVDQNFGQTMDDMAVGKRAPTFPIPLGMTPDPMRLLGADHVPLVVSAEVIAKARTKHGIGVEALKQLPARLRDPLMIFDSATQPDSLVALMDMTVKGKKVVAAVHLGKKAGRYDVNSIASVHGRDDAEVGLWVKKGLLRYWDREKGTAWLQSARLQLPMEGVAPSAKRILDKTDIVKEKQGPEGVAETQMGLFGGNEPAKTVTKKPKPVPEGQGTLFGGRAQPKFEVPKSAFTPEQIAQQTPAVQQLLATPEGKHQVPQDPLPRAIRESVVIKELVETGQLAVHTTTIQAPEDVAAIFHQIKTSKQEKLYALALDANNNVIAADLVAIGVVDSAITTPRDFLSGAYAMGAKKVIAIHNHPSLNPEPSPEDVALTNLLYSHAKDVGIEIPYHIVIDGDRFGYISPDIEPITLNSTPGRTEIRPMKSSPKFEAGFIKVKEARQSFVGDRPSGLHDPEATARFGRTLAGTKRAALGMALNAQNEPVGTWHLGEKFPSSPVAFGAMLGKMILRYNAGGIILTSETLPDQSYMRIIRQGIQAWGAELLDFVAWDGETVISAVSKGLIPKARRNSATGVTEDESPYNAGGGGGDKPPVRPTAMDSPGDYEPEQDKLFEMGESSKGTSKPPSLPTDMYLLNRRLAKQNGQFLPRAIFTINDWFREFKLFADRYAGTISTRLGNIDPSLRRKLRRFEYDSRQVTMKDMSTIKPFLEKASKLPDDVKADFDLARKNGDAQTIKEIIREHKLEPEYNAVRDVLERIHTRAEEVGYKLGYLKDYNPRAIKDAKGFVNFAKSQEKWSEIQTAIREHAQVLGRALTIEEEAAIINSMIRGYGGGKISLSKPGNLKTREIETITPLVNRFYYDSDTSLIRYVEKVNDAIEARKWFGKGNPDMNINNISDSIGTYVAKWAMERMNAGKYNLDEEQALKDILQARFNYVGMNGFLGIYRDLEYMATMGSPVSALTQIGDLGFALYRTGPLRTLGALGKTIFGRSDITRKELGLEKIGQEFADNKMSTKALEKIFTMTGLTAFDALGKQTYINAVIGRYQKDAQNPTSEFMERMEKIFGTETAGVIEDLRNKVNSENVKYLAFNEILDIQPVALSEMPQKYLSAPNGRIVYMLKSFTLKQFDFFRREAFERIFGEGKSKAQRIQGIRNLVMLGMALVLANATADEIKDFVLGRKTSLSDRVIDNLLRLAGVSKWTAYEARLKGVSVALYRTILPPMKLIDSIGKDAFAIMRSLESGKPVAGFESPSAIPLGGKLYYWWFGKGRQATDKKKAKMAAANGARTTRVATIRPVTRGVRARTVRTRVAR